MVQEAVERFDYSSTSKLYTPTYFNRTYNTYNITYDRNSENYTIVILFYQRDKQLTYTLSTFAKLANLHKVLVVWNDVEREVDPDLIPVLHVSIVVLKMTKNSLNNRFLPFVEIETDAVLNMDDDFNVDHHVIELMFDVWKSNRRAIVGPNARYASASLNSTKAVYAMPENGVYNIILTSGTFIHKDIHLAYTILMSPKIRIKVDQITNCEDIAINFLVCHLYLDAATIKVTGIQNTHGKYANHGLHQRGKSHYSNREKCVDEFTQLYGYLPLVSRKWKVV
ncbi:unnamed protein product [Bursaphelenchus okinawaensis]|uniref:Glycosyl transferase 64 domain-containing protein n=1 Tax=Bursaphelenchus okinawaensis TaxID=465554 RepID=A0A811LK45_9BILA|nr:unnamed protein product [Bursaphelenchus okinawaensis]CAG9127373.1 unnamed protein product [Bursaphelenchus okinawaensis]